MKVLIIGYFCFIVVVCQGQPAPLRPNVLDHNNQRSGDWIIYFDDQFNVLSTDKNESHFYRLLTYEQGQIIGEFTDHYANGKIFRKGRLLSLSPDRYDGLLYEFNENGHPVNAQFYRDGIIQNDLTIKHLDSLSHKLANNPEAVRAEVNVLLRIAQICLIESRLAEGFQAGERAFELIDLHLGRENEEFIEVCFILAETSGQVLNYALAEEYIHLAIRHLEATGQTAGLMYGKSHLHYSMLCRVMGKHDASVRSAQIARDIIKEKTGTFNNLYAQATYFLGMCFQSNNELDPAESLYLESRAIFEQLPNRNHYYYHGMMASLGSYYYTVQRYEEAIQILEITLNHGINSLGENHPFIGRTYYWLACTYHALGDSKAEGLYIKSLQFYEPSYGDRHQRIIESQQGLANFLYMNGRKSEAIPMYIKAMDFYSDFIRDFFDYLGESERENFYNTVRDNFEQFFSLAITEADQYPQLAEYALNLQLRQKALLLNTSNQIRRRITSSNDRKLISLYDEVMQLRQILGQTIAFTDEELLRKRGLKRDSLLTALDEKDRQINTYSSFYQIDHQALTWNNVRSKLKKNEALVEIVRFRDFDYQKQVLTEKVKYAAFVIKPKSKKPEVIILENGNYLERQGIAAYRNGIGFKVEEPFSYTLLWEPLMPALKKSKKIYFSPDGIYHQINLMTLQNPSTNEYLINELNIHLISSGRDLLIDRSGPPPGQLGILIGNPQFGKVTQGSYQNEIIPSVPGTGEEIIAISQLLKSRGWREMVYLGENAKEEVLKDMLKPKVLHIATHGFFGEDIIGKVSYEKNPLYSSGLLLTGSANTLSEEYDLRANIAHGQEDGILTAFEAMNLNIDNTDLVVLSACETGLGEISNGEGVYGLQRALIVAGAKNVIMSLWKVDDALTKELMVQFYHNWLNGMPKRQALIQAQKKIMQDYPHPYFWGAFVLIGE